MSLLDNALKIGVVRKNSESRVPDEEIELAVAYAQHKVTMNQVAGALGIKPNKVINRMNAALKDAARRGNVKF